MQLVRLKELINYVETRREKLFYWRQNECAKMFPLEHTSCIFIITVLNPFSCGLGQPKFAIALCAHLSWLHPNREEELLAAAEVPEGSERRRFQHAWERDIEADYPSGQGDGDDGGPQAVSHRDELNTNVRKLHH